MTQVIEIPCITNDGKGASFFSVKDYQLKGSSERRLSEQINAENFRLRSSDSSFSSNWHVAGDPTLLVVLAGGVKIELRDGDYRNFGAGQMFVAEDFLVPGIEFDETIHGHRAETVGDDELRNLHLKLAARTTKQQAKSSDINPDIDRWER